MEDNLKHCPFCGGIATAVATSSCSGYISCVGGCGMATNKFWDEPMSEPKERRRKWNEVAEEAWNRRVKDVQTY